jgi:hypothetical protein
MIVPAQCSGFTLSVSVSFSASPSSQYTEPLSPSNYGQNHEIFSSGFVMINFLFIIAVCIFSQLFNLSYFKDYVINKREELLSLSVFD